MKKNTIVLILFILTLLYSGTTNAGFGLGASAGYFEPADSFFRSYCPSGISYGVFGEWISDDGLGVQLESDFFIRETPYQGRDYRVLLLPTTIAIAYAPRFSERIIPLFAFGWGVYYLGNFPNENESADNLTAFGYHGSGSLRFRIAHGIFTDLRLKYSYAHLENNIHIDVGGWTSSIGVGYEFH